MLKEKMEKIKNELVKTDNKNSKKKIENIVVAILILLITVIAINAILSDGKEEEETVINTIENNNVKFEASNTDLESRLEDILSKINGVGKVEVLINYSETEQVVAMYNENKKETATEEQDESGGTRVIKENDVQKDVIYQEKDGEKIPITQKTIMPKIEGTIITATIMPKIEGTIITAEGAGSTEVQEKIINAVEAATGLASHKIQVFEMSK